MLLVATPLPQLVNCVRCPVTTAANLPSSRRRRRLRSQAVLLVVVLLLQVIVRAVGAVVNHHLRFRLVLSAPQ